MNGAPVLLCCALLLVGAVPAAAAEKVLDLQGVYREQVDEQDAYLYRLVLYNASERSLPLNSLVIPDGVGGSRSVGDDDSTVYWWRALPALLQAGGYGEVRIKMRRPGATLPMVMLPVGGEPLAVVLPEHTARLRVGSLRHDEIAGCLRVAWFNEGGEPMSRIDAWIDGQPVFSDHGSFASGPVHLCELPLDGRAVGSVHALSLRADEDAWQHIVFRVPPPVRLLSEGGIELWSGRRVYAGVDEVLAEAPPARQLRVCLTHLPAQPQSNAWDALRSDWQQQAREPHSLGLIHLCRYARDDGLSAFGRLVDGVVVNLHPDDGPTNWARATAIIARAKLSTGPEGMRALVPTEKGARVLARTLHALVHGAAGVHFRYSDGFGHEDCANTLAPLRPSLPVWSAAVPLAHLTVNDEGVSAWLVDLGRRRAAAVFLDADQGLARPVSCALRLPGGRRAQRLVGLDGSTLVSFAEPMADFEITLPHFSDVAVVYVELDDDR